MFRGYVSAYNRDKTDWTISVPYFVPEDASVQVGIIETKELGPEGVHKFQITAYTKDFVSTCANAVRLRETTIGRYQQHSRRSRSA